MAANQIQQILVKRGNTASISSYTGPLGELVLNTQTNQLVAQDGVTPGGRLVTGDTFPIVANLTVLQLEVANIAGISGNVAQLQSFFANVNLEGISTTIANLQLAANSSYGNANAAAYLPIYGGTVGTNLINFTNSNGQIESGETTGQPNSSWIEMTANIQHDIAGFYAAENGSAQVYSAQDVLLFSNTIGSTAPLWTFDRTGNLNLPSTTGRILFPYNENSNAIIDYSQDIGQFFVIQNNFVDGHQGINLDTDDAQVQISSKNSGGYPLRTWNFDWQGQLTYPDSTIQITAYQGPAGQTSFATQANVITANTSMKGYVDNQITLLVNNAPAILDTLGQIAANLQADESSLTRVILGQAAANTQISALQANVGSYYIWANANTAGLYNSIVGANTAWTANAATQQGLITALQANTGGLYNSIAGANSTIQALSANVGSFYTWANTNFGTSSYANANVAAYLVANPQAGTYSNTNANALLSSNTVATINTTGNIKTIANVIGTTFMFANGVNILSTIAPSSTYSNANIVANLQNYVTSIGTTANITTTANMIAPNYLFANGVNILSTITPSSSYSNTNVAAYLTTAAITTTGNITAGNLTTSGTYTVANITTTGAYGNITGANVISANTISATNFVYSANGVSILSGIGGTYSNTNVAAYLTTQTFYSNSNVASYLVANPQGSTYSNANVVANLANYVTNIVSTANITAGNVIATQYGNSVGTTATYTGNVTAAYFVGKGSALTGLTYNNVGNIYGSSSNVTLVAGNYSSTFANTGMVTMPNVTVSSNLVVSSSGQFTGAYNENTTLPGVFIGNTGSGTPSPRIGFYNGTTSQNWQIDNYGGQFRWFTPGVTQMTLDSTGSLSVTNATVTTLSVTGNATVTGNITLSGNAGVIQSNCTAFRVIGQGGSIGLNANLVATNWTVDYTQGFASTALNGTTGIFTAPMTGLYSSTLTARTTSNSYASIVQACIMQRKAGTSSVAMMIEWGANTTMNHASGGTTVKLAQGDQLWVQCLANGGGTGFSFDGNDHWDVTYLG